MEDYCNISESIVMQVFVDVPGNAALPTLMKCKKLLEVMQKSGVANIDEALEVIAYTGAYIGQRRPWCNTL